MAGTVAPLRAAEAPAIQPVSVTTRTATNTEPAISADGRIVAYTCVADDGASRVMIVDRETAKTVAVPTTGATHPTVSGDGCVIAYVAPGPPRVAGIRADVWSRDRCTGTTRRVLRTTVDATDLSGVGAPAVSFDGSVVAWSTGDEVVTFELVDDAYVAGPSFDASPTPGDSVVAPDIDVSSDGRVVVFAAGPAGGPYAPSPSNVHVARTSDGGTAIELLSVRPDGAPGTADSRRPSVSGDGLLIVFESAGADLAAASETPPEDLGDSFLVLVDDTSATRLLATDGFAPSMSDDGGHVVYERDGQIRVVSAVGDDDPSDDTPFGVVTDQLVSTPYDGSPGSTGSAVTRASVSAGGRYIAFDSANGIELTADTEFHSGTQAWVRSRFLQLSASDLDLGTAPAGTQLTGTLSFENTGRVGIGVRAVRAGAPLDVLFTSCTGTIAPGALCDVEVRVTVGAQGTAEAEVTIEGTGWPVTEHVGVVSWGTSVATTVTPTTLPPTTAPPTTVRPRPTPRPTSPPTTTIPASARLSFSPSSFEFAPTIVDAGRRTGVVTLVNGATGVVDVAAIRLLGDPGFAVSDDGCSGSRLAARAVCSVSIEFAPTSTGDLNAVLEAVAGDGRGIVASITGVGAPPPTLTIVPGVATPRQVVTLIGAGFPAGADVELRFGQVGGTVPTTILVDDAGNFVQTVLVLPNTPSGPLTVVVAGQADLFGDVTAELLVTGRNEPSPGAVLGSLGPSLIR